MPHGLGGSGDRALLPVGRRFFDFAQNDIIALCSGGTFLDTLIEGKTATKPGSDVIVSLEQVLEIARHIRRFQEGPA